MACSPRWSPAPLPRSRTTCTTPSSSRPIRTCRSGSRPSSCTSRGWAQPPSALAAICCCARARASPVRVRCLRMQRTLWTPHDEWHDPARGRHRRGAGGRGSTSHGQPINGRLYSASVVLYTLSYELPAAILGGAVSAWGWQAALLSMAPLVMWIDHPIGNADMVLLAALVTPSNLAFVAAAILLPLRRRRAAIVCAALALASMIYGGFAVPAQQSELVRGPAGHLGSGYYAWVTAGALLLWTAFSSRSAA